MSRPRILVADDNALSLRFFADALESFDLDCTLAPDGTQALEKASHDVFDLLLLDVNMPGRGGAAALAALRAGDGPSRDAIAIATSADVSAADDLLRAGFVQVLPKPVGVAALHAALQRHLPTFGAASDLDDAQALSAAGGDAAIVAALRGLFADELDTLPAEIAAMAAAADIAALRERLHRLDASAGFCGTPALQAAIARLRARLDATSWPHDAIAPFLGACARVRAALEVCALQNRG